jgi:PAS domain S-box-containing protein
MLSARAGEESRIEGRDAGADDYLVKPFSGRELIAQVRSQLSIRRIRFATARERELLLAAERDARYDAQLERARLVEFLTQAPNPIVILRGPNHVVELANAAACKVWGRKPEDVLKKPVFEAVPEAKGKGFEEILDEVMRTGKPYHGKQLPRYIGKQGTQTAYFNFVYSPLRAADGSVEGVLASSFDVTEEVLARREVEELRGKAEAANRTKDAFLAMLGHELRNPLSPIVGALKLMRLRGIQATELDILERQASHLTRLVDDLLDVSRIARGRLELRRRPVEMASVIRRAMDMAAPLVSGRSHSMELRLPDEPLVVMGDADRLAQVVSNLLTNAAKYSDPGSTITLAAERVGERILLSVEDRGMGIAPEMQPKIFDLFVQQEQTLDRAEGGLGLGLAIVKNLVQAHGGVATVHSDGLGKGSRFVIDLPAAAASGPVEQEEPSPAITRSGEPLRVLVVDDNADAVSTLGESLRLLGHSVQIASDGEEALRLAHGFAPDVALIDIGLPRMDGYELARQLRSLPNPPKRLFAVTGYGLETDRQRAIGAGFNRHFVKPVDVMELDDALAFGERQTKASA